MIPAPSSLAIDQLHLRLFAVDRTWIDAERWTLHNVQDSFWRLYINAGDGAALLLPASDARVTRYELRARQLYFIPAGVRFDTTTRERIRHFFVHLDVLGMPRAALQALFSAPVHVPYSDVREREAQALEAEAGAGERLSLVAQCRVKALLYSALAAYLAQIPAELYGRYQQLIEAQAPVQPALQEIDAHLGRQLSNRYLAQLCHLSEDYFIRLFRTSVGLSPTRYIQSERVRRAAQRLLFSADSIDTIAVATGFGNRFYFSRVFARHLGVAPASYRRMARV